MADPKESQAPGRRGIFIVPFLRANCWLQKRLLLGLIFSGPGTFPGPRSFWRMRCLFLKGEPSVKMTGRPTNCQNHNIAAWVLAFWQESKHSPHLPNYVRLRSPVSLRLCQGARCSGLVPSAARELWLECTSRSRRWLGKPHKPWLVPTQVEGSNRDMFLCPGFAQTQL